MASFPISLPTPTVSGYQGKAGANVQRTDFDAGPARQRLRYGTAPDEVSVSWKLKDAEFVTFKEFWRDEINKGTDYFLMDLPMGGGIATHEVRFVGGGYEYQILPGTNWQVTAKLDVRTV
jgi:hypothetical protein